MGIRASGQWVATPTRAARRSWSLAVAVLLSALRASAQGEQPAAPPPGSAEAEPSPSERPPTPPPSAADATGREERPEAPPPAPTQSTVPETQSAAPPPSSVEIAEPAPTEEPPTTPTVETHGFVSQGFIKTTKNNYLASSERGSFEFSEVGINLTANPMDKLRVGVQLFAHDLGPLGNYKPRFDWYYLDYRFWDWLGIRAGRTKIPFGLYNETNDIDAARVPILLPQSVYPVQNRDYLLAQTGGELYGTVSLGSGGGDLEYRAYGGTLFVDPSESQNVASNISVPYLVGGRLMWQTPLDGLQMGGSAQALRLDADFTPTPSMLAGLRAARQIPADFTGTASLRIDAVLGVASVEYAAHDLLLASEYSRWRVHATSSLDALVPKAVTENERFYVMGSYRLSPSFAPGLYYSVLFSDADVTAIGHTTSQTRRDTYQHDVAATLRYDINPHWLVKLEGHYMHGTAALSSDLNGGAPLSSLAPDWALFLIKTTAYF